MACVAVSPRILLRLLSIAFSKALLNLWFSSLIDSCGSTESTLLMFKLVDFFDVGVMEI